MAESPMVGARVPQEWHQQIRQIAITAGRKEAEVVREAIAQYLDQVDPNSVKGAISDLQERLTEVEQELSGLRRLVGSRLRNCT